MKTEARHPASRRLDTFSSLQVLRLMNRADVDAVRAVRKRLKPLAQLADRIAEALDRGGRVFFVGAGTSGRLAAAEAAECPPTFGLSPRAVQAVVAGGTRALARSVEGAEDDQVAAVDEMRRRKISELDLVIGVSASGRTPFVLSALAYAKSVGADHALISCNPVPGAIDLPTGPEIVSGSTRLKAGTATKMALNMLTTAAMVRHQKVYAGYMIDVQATNQKLMRRAERIVREVTRVGSGPARRALKLARGRAKLAIAMLAHRNFDYASARALLRRHRDSLRALLAEVHSLGDRRK
jgi:N-acetylmuramic acid 6-phosphate etherase